MSDYFGDAVNWADLQEEVADWRFALGLPGVYQLGTGVPITSRMVYMRGSGETRPGRNTRNAKVVESQHRFQLRRRELPNPKPGAIIVWPDPATTDAAVLATNPSRSWKVIDTDAGFDTSETDVTVFVQPLT